MNVDEALADARARLLHDLAATTPTTPAVVDVLEDVLTERRSWAAPWPDGAAFLTCLVAQDLQESLAEIIGRWPNCRLDGGHQLHVEPDLGENPRWVCESCAAVAAPIGGL
jgi:hypothetical protein